MGGVTEIGEPEVDMTVICDECGKHTGMLRVDLKQGCVFIACRSCRHRSFIVVPYNTKGTTITKGQGVKVEREM